MVHNNLEHTMHLALKKEKHATQRLGEVLQNSGSESPGEPGETGSAAEAAFLCFFDARFELLELAPDDCALAATEATTHTATRVPEGPHASAPLALTCSMSELVALAVVVKESEVSAAKSSFSKLTLAEEVDEPV